MRALDWHAPEWIASHWGQLVCQRSRMTDLGWGTSSLLHISLQKNKNKTRVQVAMLIKIAIFTDARDFSLLQLLAYEEHTVEATQTLQQNQERERRKRLRLIEKKTYRDSRPKSSAHVPDIAKGTGAQI